MRVREPDLRLSAFMNQSAVRHTELATRTQMMSGRTKIERLMPFALAALLITPVAVAQGLRDRGSQRGHVAPDAGAAQTGAERVFELPLRDGAHQRVLFSVLPNARGTIVMLPGGAGDVGLERDGDIRHDNNFVVRSRALWNRHGYAVLIPDTIDRANLRGVRSSPDYANLVNDLVGFAHGQVRGPVFLLGTSQGSIAAMNGAAHAAPGSIAGVVLTESLSVMAPRGERHRLIDR